jgi:membrane protein YqaA with SNARE-associated domain
VPSFALLILASSWSYSIVSFSRRLGALGLFLLGALDSSFLVLPFGNDFLLIALVSSSRGLVWIVYVMVSVLGSLLGVFIVDSIMRKAGEKGLAKFVKPNRVKQLKKKMDKGVGWVIFTSTLLPPPFPFTPVIMSASALQTSRAKLYGGVFAGRLVRFTIEALLALYFGKHILRFLNSPIVDYIVYALILIAVVGSVLSILKWLRSNKRKDERAAQRRRQKKKADRA